MAKQVIDTGIEGNDGTGDSIRESFKKVNANFTELYAIFGLGGQISFTNLSDTPDTLLGNEGKIPIVKSDATGIDFFQLVSGAGTNDSNNTDNTISFRIEDKKLIVESVNTKLSSDTSPSVLNPFNVSSSAAYNNTTHNTLLNDNARINLVNAWNITHPNSSPITENNLLISKGYGDLNYVNRTGDEMLGTLRVPPADIPSGSGDQVPQIQEVVKKSGDIMTGPLTLFDHPNPFNGMGIAGSDQDLQAATKFYVDASVFTSAINLHVAVNGTDDESTMPLGRAGRSQAYAYRTIGAACARAERIQQASEPDLGPYIQTITFTETEFGDNNATINEVLGYGTISSQQEQIAQLLIDERAGIVDDTIERIQEEFPDFIYNESLYRRDLGLIIDSIRLDILASTSSTKHNYLTRFAGLRYFANPSSELAISPLGQLSETLDALQFAKLRTLQLISSELSISSGEWYNAVGNRFDDILTTIDTESPDPSLAESSDFYRITINSGPNRQTDQSIAANPDLIPGKIIRGKDSGAIGQIVSYTRGIDTSGTPSFDTVELLLLLPIDFEEDEELEYANLVNKKQITIRVESGIYEEHLPIRVPADVSIKGDEFRRVLIRPAKGISQSPWTKTWFFRNAEFDGLTIATGGVSAFDVNNNLVGYYGHHYLSDPNDIDSEPLRNDQMDVFLMNDNTILRNITCQRHGGFMMVLDPDGQILTRSPYAQTCTSFSKSLNRKAFHGGMYIDGYASNIPLSVIGKNGNFILNVVAPSDTGLGLRKQPTPCSFYMNGFRYQINSIINYVADDNGTASATLILDETSNEGQGFEDSVSAGDPVAIVLQGGGNKSMLANDFTQINDLGYGISCNNNALAELVSVFSYYCHAGYYSKNGSQIRSLTGNNSYGNFGMISEGSDPDEISRTVTLDQNLVQPIKIYSVTQELTFSGDITGSVSDGDSISQEQPDEDDSTARIAFVSYDSTADETIVFIERNVGGFTNNDVVQNVTTSSPIGTPDSVIARNFGANTNAVALYIYDVTDFPLNGSEVEILHNSGVFQPYEVVTVSETDQEIPLDREADLCGSANTDLRRRVWRLDLTSVVATADTGLKEITNFGTFALFRAKQNFLISGIDSDTLTRPSTALVWTDQPELTYRTIAFENTVVGSIPVVFDQTRIITDDNFGYINLAVDNTRSQFDASTIDASWSGTLGSTAGDTRVAISVLSSDDSARVVGTLITWAGVLHEIIDYQEEQDGPTTYGILTLADLYSLDPNHTSGIRVSVRSNIGDIITLQAGLAAGAEGNVTVNISTCRATSHDFLDIGTGGYNDTNFPDRIYGRSINSPVSEGDAVDSRGFNTKAQVQERTRGRVFFASTDQDGFFRVGRFFTVDQGTGRVTFNAALVLTNIDGIGFRRGVRVNEFSPDTSFVNARGDSVPTQTAVEGYINRRLGWDRDGDFLGSGDILGGGAVNKSGDIMSGTLNMGSNRITNVSLPGINSDVANKLYVDSAVQSIDSLFKLQDVEFDLPVQNAQMIVFNGSTNQWNNITFSDNAANTDIEVTFAGGIASAKINTGVIRNENVNNSAAIAQSKLNMNAATTRANASGITQADRGLASFNSAEFTANNGWISISTNGIANNKLVNSNITIGSTSINLGASSASLAGLTNVTSGTFTGNLNGNVTSTGTSTFNNLSVSNPISGDLNGNANTLTLIARNTNNNSHFITFSQSGNGSAAQYTDTGLRFVPTNDVLTVGNIVLNGGQGSITTSGNILPGTNSPTDSGQNLGTSARRWNTVWATFFQGTSSRALYADLAENYLGDADYEFGTVVVFGGTCEITTTDKKGDHRVAGIVSTNPAYLMNSELEGDHVTAIALQGRVPCKVIGKVQKGDLLICSAIPGYAMVDNNPRPGTVIGKSLTNKNDDSKGIIEVVVGKH